MNSLLLFAIVAVVGLVLVVALVILIIMIFRRKSTDRGEDQENLTIDIRQLPSHGPASNGLASNGPQLELFGTRVRIAVLVIAPAGRGSELPSKFNLPGVIDGVVPGLMELVNLHEPIFRRWPQQLSVQGFVHSFFSNMELPGERGSDTPWASVAGRVQVSGHSLLLGLVLCADESNNIGQLTAEHAGQWLDMLRIRK
ncbi:MAG: hypothetical protein ACI9G1_000104 [Pirellulaceae bacterium]|jgi:hypothetical protein